MVAEFDRTFDQKGTPGAQIKEMRRELRAQVKERRNEMTPESRRLKSQQVCERLLGLLDGIVEQERARGVGASCDMSCSINLGVYSAFAEELDLGLLIEGAFERGVTVSFPCMMHDARCCQGSCEQTMEFRAVSFDDYALTKKTLAGKGSTRKLAAEEEERGVSFLLHPLRRYHHADPELDQLPYVPADELDLLVCPCVAFDGKGNRLGYGAGNYDRYLTQFRYRGIGLDGGIDDATAGLSAFEACCIVGVAFEEQRVGSIPVEEHDIPLPFVSA